MGAGFQRAGRTHRADSGFSLVELMVVIFLVSLATTFIVLTAPPGKSQARVTAETLAARLQQLSDRAVVSGQTLALRVDADSLTALARREGSWAALPDATVKTPQGVEIKALHETEADKEAARGPDAVFDPLGGARAARISVRDRREAFEITVTPAGEIRLEEVG